VVCSIKKDNRIRRVCGGKNMKKVSSVCAKAEIDAHRLREYYDVLLSKYNAGKLTDEEVEKEITFENLSKLIDMKNIRIGTGDKNG